MGLTRFKPKVLPGRLIMLPSLGWTGQVQVPFQGGFFGDRCPTALPWAASDVPLTGGEI